MAAQRAGQPREWRRPTLWHPAAGTVDFRHHRRGGARRGGARRGRRRVPLRGWAWLPDRLGHIRALPARPGRGRCLAPGFRCSVRGGGAGLVVAGLDLLDQLRELGKQAGEPGQQQREKNPGHRVSPRHPLAQSLVDQGKTLGDARESGWGGLHIGNIPRTTTGVKNRFGSICGAPARAGRPRRRRRTPPPDSPGRTAAHAGWHGESGRGLPPRRSAWRGRRRQDRPRGSWRGRWRRRRPPASPRA
jgi:hypothetical protein